MITDDRARGEWKRCVLPLWYVVSHFPFGWVVFWEVFHCFVTTNCDMLWSECVTETRSRTERVICCVSSAACLSEGRQLEGWSSVSNTVVSVASWSAFKTATFLKQIFAVGVVWHFLFVWIVDSFVCWSALLLAIFKGYCHDQPIRARRCPEAGDRAQRCWPGVT